MRFRRYGNSGLRMSIFSLGGWLTYGGSVEDNATKEIMKVAFENGINTFDTAEVYSAGKCETSMGKAIKELGWRRSDVVMVTKIFFGTGGKEPNARGLSRKHIVEGANASLQRAGLEYWDVIMAHRCDVSTPMVEIVKAFNHLIETGKCFYWGVSCWTAQQIQEAYGIAERLGLEPPLADQQHYSALYREPVEKEYLPLYSRYKLGIMAWSPLEGGILTGKYNGGIPQGSRLDVLKDSFKQTLEKLQSPEGKSQIEKVQRLTKIAESLSCSTTVLSLAWAAKNENITTVILGATKTEQLLENLKALDVIDKLTPDILHQIEEILANKPEPLPSYGREM
ncbi:hypothetical protein L7F22_067968 [Adiantum nelumboides]|nr:hypothetical protein [Adiantum nelumboides]